MDLPRGPRHDLLEERDVVTMAGQTYQAASNHDPDGSSNGTTITVIRP